MFHFTQSVRSYDVETDAWTSSPVDGSLMLMDTAISPKGVVMSTGMGVFTSTDGKSYSKAPVYGVSQAIYTYGEDSEKFAIVGAFDVKDTDGHLMPVNGVAYSTDSGATFQVSSNIQDGDCRYGAFPSESTWYVSQGMWPMDDVEFSKGDYFQFSSHMKLHRENGNVKMQDSLAVKVDR